MRGHSTINVIGCTSTMEGTNAATLAHCPSAAFTVRRTRGPDLIVAHIRSTDGRTSIRAALSASFSLCWRGASNFGAFTHRVRLATPLLSASFSHHQARKLTMRSNPLGYACARGAIINTTCTCIIGCGLPFPRNIPCACVYLCWNTTDSSKSLKKRGSARKYAKSQVTRALVQRTLEQYYATRYATFSATY